MEIKKIGELLKLNPYQGRGIIMGRVPAGNKAALAYFIMGRSENSRNRIFVESGGKAKNIRSKAFDESKVIDPSLIIYTAVRVYDNRVIITNGDHTDKIVKLMDKQMTFEQALREIDFEPDAPFYTPRISSIMHFCFGESRRFNYAMAISKTAGGDPTSCQRFLYAYNSPIAGQGHFIHTYMSDREPMPSFTGEPHTIEIPDNIDDFTNSIWDNLDNNNKISLFTRYINVSSGEDESRIINKNVKNV